MSQTLLLRQTQNSNPLHTVLRERLRESLQKQEPGARVPAERVLAKEFGVSTATVSRALQELQQEGMLQRIPGKGTYLSVPNATGFEVRDTYLVDESATVELLTKESERSYAGTGIPFTPAPSVAGGETTLDAWVIVQLEPYETELDLASEFWPQRIVAHLEYLVASQGGKSKITVGHTLTEAQCYEAWRAAIASGVNCIFLVLNERNPLVDVWIEQFVSSHIGQDAEGADKRAPVIIQISLAGMPHAYFDTVSFDGEWGAYLAAAHLLKLGHRNIAFLAPDREFPWLDQRILGFHRAMRGFGIHIDRDEHEFGVIRVAESFEGPQAWQSRGAIASEFIDASSPVTAVLAANDQMASGFISRMRAAGRDIPGSLSVVGYDDRFASVMEGLTTVRPPIEDIAEAALNLAKRRLDEPASREHVHLFLKPTLMVRNTTQPPA